MKIAVTGYSGSGKSTLASRLGERYKIPVLHLDMVHWLPGWEEQETEKEQARVRKFMDENRSWVIDGNYTKLEYERRLREADQIVILAFGRIPCFFRAYKRYLNHRGRVRESMTEGCPEKFDLEFARWILFDGRTKAHKENYRRIERSYPEKTVVIRNQRELDRFLAGCAREKKTP